MTIRGWVYIIENESMPNILKIGYSTKDPVLRAKELAGTGSPHPFRVVFDLLVEEPRSIEQAAHAILASKREGKEWFRCTHSEAIAVIRACAKLVLIERNNASEECGPHHGDDGQVKQEPTRCCFYSCGNMAASVYKGISYCDEHYKAMRKQRFDFARSIRNG